MTELRLYPFQNDCVSDLRAAIMRSMSAALVLSTGAGKTVIAGRVAQLAAAKGSTTLLLVHRRELVRQSIKTLKLAVPGMPIGVEAAGWPAMPWAKLHVGMVQSIARREFTCNPDIVIVDEAHHARAPTWEKVLARWPHAVRIGLTATPERLDGRGLGEHFQEMVLGPPMAWLVENSYLAPTRTLTVPSSWEDMASVRRTKSGDYRSKDLAERVTDRVVADAAKAYMRHTPGQQAIFFGVDTNHSKMVCAKLRDYGIAAEHVDGKDHEARRDRIMAEFSERRIQVVGNCDLICLDDQTEILTRCGWRGIDEMRDDDIVANWHLDGTITFGPIRSLIRRETTAHERMVSYLSPREIKFRVTSNHRMVHRKRDGAWQVTDAHSIVGQRVIVPVAGVAAPETPPMPAPRRPRLTKAARIRATSYNLRQRHGMGHAQARAEAERRIDRRDALAYTEPSSLTLDDCAFIGFWLGDGSRTEFPGGGVEYKLFQSTRYESIVAWVDRTITECGFDSIRRVSDYGDGQYRLVSWSLPRGTGHGPQQRDGVFRLEPYLDKDGSDLLWGLDRDQFAELLRGFHRADGLHRQHGDTVTITNTRKALMELLQTIAVCRGMRANIRRSDNGPRATTPIWRLSVSFHRDAIELGAGSVQITDEGHTTERVWCVNNDSTFIVTRRNGRVVVMGNSEGFDAPSCDVVIMGRHTNSVPVYLQQGGRPMRYDNVRPDKVATIVDTVGNVYNLGLVDDPREWSLADGEVRQKPQDKPMTPRPCENCATAFRGLVCPHCGHYRASRPIVVKEQDVELVEAKPNPNRRTEYRRNRGMDRAEAVLHLCTNRWQFIQECIKIRDELGYAAGWEWIAAKLVWDQLHEAAV